MPVVIDTLIVADQVSIHAGSSLDITSETWAFQLPAGVSEPCVDVFYRTDVPGRSNHKETAFLRPGTLWVKQTVSSRIIL